MSVIIGGITIETADTAPNCLNEGHVLWESMYMVGYVLLEDVSYERTGFSGGNIYLG